MALISRTDVIDSFKKSFKNKYEDTMTNTRAIEASVVNVASISSKKVAAIREAFNNRQAQSTAEHSSIFGDIFKSIKSGKDKAEDEAEDKFISSGTKEENDDTDAPISQMSDGISADTSSRNKTSYDIAGIQVKAVVAQTQAIVTTLTKHEEYLKNIDTNLQKILTSMTNGFKSLSEQNEEQAKASYLYNQNGYLNVGEYLKQVNEGVGKYLAMGQQALNVLKNPKQLVQFATDAIADSKPITKLMTNIESSVSKAFTSAVDSITKSSLLKSNNIITNAIRQILTPNLNGNDIKGAMQLENGIDGKKAAQFDNITHRTINDVLPGLLERILRQNEMLTSIMQQNTGIKGKFSGTTYDMKSGRFSTYDDLKDETRQVYKETMETPSIEAGGEIDLTQFEKALRPMIFYMAAANIPIQNFWKMSYFNARKYLQLGLGVKEIPDDESFQLLSFWNIMHGNKASDRMEIKHRKAIEQISRLYFQMKQSIDNLNNEVDKDLANGLRRHDQLKMYDGWLASEIANGRLNDFEADDKRTTATITEEDEDGKKVKKSAKLVNTRNFEEDTDSLKDIASDLISETKSAVVDAFDDVKEAVKHPGNVLTKMFGMMSKEGSIYVHDTVLIEYFKAFFQAVKPGAYKKAKGAEQRQQRHKAAHPNESGVAEPTYQEPSKKKDRQIDRGDTSYADDSPIGEKKSTGELVGSMGQKLQYEGMKFAKAAGYKGFDDKLKSDQYAAFVANDRNKSGWYERSQHFMDVKTAEVEIQSALDAGNISLEQAQQLRETLRTSDPSEYKNSLMKTIGRWTPAMVGGLLLGPPGFFAGLGIKHFMSKSTAATVEKDLKRMSKKNKIERTNAEKDKQRLQYELQEAFEAGKLTLDEYHEAQQQINLLGPNDYKNGLSRWAKRLGPIAAASLLGAGPLGLLVAGVVGAKWAKPEHKKIRKQIRGIKANSEVWDDAKRKKLIADIDKKIKELEETVAAIGEPTNDGDQQAIDEAKSNIAELKKYRDEISYAGGAKLGWYLLSIPGWLQGIKNIRKLPKMLVTGAFKLTKVVAKGAWDLTTAAASKIKAEATKAIYRTFFYDERIKTEDGRALIMEELDSQMRNGEIKETEYYKRLGQFKKACAKYDKTLGATGIIWKATQGIRKTIRGATGILTGRTYKEAAAKANSSAVNARRLLNGKTTDSQAINEQLANEQLAVAQSTSDSVSDIKKGLFSGNSANTSDAGTHELLKQILIAVNPNADMTQFNRIESAHHTDSPESIQTTPTGKRIVKGQVQSDNRESKEAIRTAAVAMAGVDDERELGTKREMKKALVDSTDDPAAKQQIEQLADKTYRNLAKDKSENDTSGEKKGFLESLFGGDSSDGNGHPIANYFASALGAKGLWNTVKGGISKIANIAIPAFVGYHTAKQGLKGFFDPYNEQAETREHHAQSNAHARATAAIYGSTAIRAMRAMNSTGANMFDSYNIGSLMIGDKLKAGITGAKNILNNAATKNPKGIIGTCKKLMDQCIKHLGDKSTFLGKIFGLFDKCFKGKGKTLGDVVKKFFNSSVMKSVARVLMAVGIALEIFADILDQLEEAGTNIHEELDKAINSKDTFGGKISAGFNCLKDNFQEAAELGGDGFLEMLLNATAKAGISTATSFIPVYGQIKMGLAILSLVLGFLTQGEGNPNSITYCLLMCWKYLVDDILALDDGLIENVARLLVDILGLIVGIFTLNLTKIVDNLKEIVTGATKIMSDMTNTSLLIIVDLIIIALFGVPVLNVFMFAFIKLKGGANAILGVRKYTGQLITGEISFSEWWKGIRGKNNADVVDTEDTGKGRKFGYGSGMAIYNDLYQESPMYRNAPENMFEAGCGPIALTAALRQQGVNSDPMNTAVNLRGFRSADGGTDPSGISAVGNSLGGRFSNGPTNIMSIARSASQGKPVVMMGQNGAFGDGMHYMTAVGSRNGKLLVRDPLKPSIQEISPEAIAGNVENATYGIGGAGYGRGRRRYGRGLDGNESYMEDGAKSSSSSSSTSSSPLGSIISGFMTAASTAATAINSLFGGWLGIGDSSGESYTGNQGMDGAVNADYSEQPAIIPVDEDSSYLTGKAKIPEGNAKSLNGQLIYPEEIRKDPTSPFPYDGSGGDMYGRLLPVVKDILIKQYKYTLILPSVIACIMRGETEFGREGKCHEKNLGNIRDFQNGHGFGTKAVSNYITDSQMGDRGNYEAYNYYGESMYRIGMLLSHGAAYAGTGVVGNKDTLSSLKCIEAKYAYVGWADALYGYWRPEHMSILKQYDKEAINDMYKNDLAVVDKRNSTDEEFKEYVDNMPADKKAQWTREDMMTNTELARQHQAEQALISYCKSLGIRTDGQQLSEEQWKNFSKSTGYTMDDLSTQTRSFLGIDNQKGWSKEHWDEYDKWYDKAHGFGRKRKGGKGLAEFFSRINPALDSLGNSFNNIFGDTFGNVNAGNTSFTTDQLTEAGTEGNLNDSSYTQQVVSNPDEEKNRDQRVSPKTAPKVTANSFGEKVLKDIQRSNPNAYKSLGWHEAAAGFYSNGSDPNSWHQGIDISGAQQEGADIHSPVSGTISDIIGNVTMGDGKSAGEYGTGNMIRIKAKDGKYHWFMHLKPGSLTNKGKGATVAEGEYIGQLGNTGNSSGPHLHYQINESEAKWPRSGGVSVDPYSVSGKGRGRLFNNNLDQYQYGVGGPVNNTTEPIDYNKLLEKMYDVLVQIANNTGMNIDLINNAGGRGGNNKGVTQIPIRREQYIPQTNSLGVGYQRLVRGYR